MLTYYDDLFKREKDTIKKSENIHKEYFNCEEGDFIFFLKIYH